MNIAIARTLVFYKLYPFLNVFIRNLGHNLIVSKKSDSSIFKKSSDTPDDICMPFKLAYLHTKELIQNSDVDKILLVRANSIDKETYFCPKFIGYPDYVKNSFNYNNFLILDLNKKKHSLYLTFFKFGLKLNSNPFKVYRAIEKAIAENNRFNRLKLNFRVDFLFDYIEKNGSLKSFNILDKREDNSRIKLGIISHPYIIYDKLLSSDIFRFLSENRISFVTIENIEKKILDSYDLRLDFKHFWNFGKEILKSMEYFYENNDIDGIIYITSFCCGPDSIYREYLNIIKEQKNSKKPVMSIVLDEHSSFVGYITRLEAFIDLINFKREQ